MTRLFFGSSFSANWFAWQMAETADKSFLAWLEQKLEAQWRHLICRWHPGAPFTDPI
ncbi:MULTISPECIES: hypothetical protein [Prochlorococcus]|uniref:hypothetical protein n=1 Tax=Prochlorococcus TaxID=1218 RepID=UPI0019815698|nr:MULTISPECIES: hypothetical protein [Prochlorococcus]